MEEQAKGAAAVNPGRVDQVVVYGPNAVLVHPVDAKGRNQSWKDQRLEGGEPAQFIHDDQLGNQVKLGRDHHGHQAQCK